MHLYDLILKKRNGKELLKAEINYIIENYTNGKIPDYQISALLMAIYFQGMTDEEATNLALAMRDSGDIIDLSLIKGIKVDKHSTGGVGDKVTLVLGPLLSYFGIKFAKMSGRGLGHTGGTVDKLESIPGFRVELSKNEFINQVNNINISVVGQSGDIAPADKKFYALRDVTATIDSIPLIASSIMSKKLASGADAICLDIKVGDGAFMKNETEAKKLAELMVNIGRLANKKMSAVLTSMDEPLGFMIGNKLEVIEAISTLKGHGPKDLVEVTTTIGAYLMLDANIENDFVIAKEKLIDTLNKGLAYEVLEKLVKAQNGDLTKLNDTKAKTIIDVLAKKEGYVTELKALDLGVAALRLGAGRETKEDLIDYDVGIELVKKIGDYVEEGDVIAKLYVNDKGIDEAIELVLQAYQISNIKKDIKLIIDVIR